MSILVFVLVNSSSSGSIPLWCICSYVVLEGNRRTGTLYFTTLYTDCVRPWFTAKCISNNDVSFEAPYVQTCKQSRSRVSYWRYYMTVWLTRRCRRQRLARYADHMNHVTVICWQHLGPVTSRFHFRFLTLYQLAICLSWLLWYHYILKL